MELNETFKVKIDSYDINGYGVCHIDKKIVFVEGAMEGEVVIIKITDIHSKFCFAKTIKILEKSPNRIESLCPYSKLCGGCDLLHMNYETETKIKENKVRQTLRKFNYKENPIIKNDNIFGYRNKIMVPFRKDEEGDVIYGFYEKMTHNVISMDKCIISNDKSNEILHYIARYISIFNVSVYNEEKNIGLFKEVMIRNTALNEYMVVLIVTADHDFTNLVNFLTDNFKEIKSIWLNINSKLTNVVLSDSYKLLYGNETIIEDILGLKFNVSAASFMQVNHDNCEKLYSEALRLADLKPNMNVIDAYCGMGSITLNIAKKVNHVYGIEVVEPAIINANNNKLLNNIKNADFICGKCEDVIKDLSSKEKIDCIFFDPPRKGCEKSFLETVIQMKIPKIVYISCNIATASRDIEILEKEGYKLESVTPCDLFSRTSHVETVCLLNRRND